MTTPEQQRRGFYEGYVPGQRGTAYNEARKMDMEEETKRDLADDARMMDPRVQIVHIRDTIDQLAGKTSIQWALNEIRHAVSALEGILDEQAMRIAALEAMRTGLRSERDRFRELLVAARLQEREKFAANAPKLDIEA